MIANDPLARSFKDGAPPPGHAFAAKPGSKEAMKTKAEKAKAAKAKTRARKNSLDEMGLGDGRAVPLGSEAKADLIKATKPPTEATGKAKPRSSGGKPGTRTKKGKSHRSGF